MAKLLKATMAGGSSADFAGVVGLGYAWMKAMGALAAGTGASLADK